MKRYKSRFAWGVVILALGLAGCVDGPSYPVRAPEAAPAPPPPEPAPPPAPAPPPQPPRDPDAPRAAPSTPIESAPLPPIGRAAPPRPPTPAYAVAPRSAPVAATAPTPKPGPAPSRTTQAASEASPWVQPPSATEIPSQVTVGRDETLFDVAERVRTPVRALIEINALQPPYNLAAGTVLRVPPPVFYTVAEGDTLFGIARRFNIDPRSLANLNGIQLETTIKPGQKIALPSLARDQGSNQQATNASPAGVAPTIITSSASNPSSRTTPAGSTAAPSAAPPPAVSEPSANDALVAAAGRGKFAWPVHGEVLSTFGPKGPGQRNDGVNIAAAAGTSVHAAAAGEVVFAGELPGFGNLVLLKHEGGWVTAYAHLAKPAVKIRDTVAQGQEVGQAGQTGLVDRPQLHFEIRYAANPRDKAKPVDPSLLLPSEG